MRGTAYPIGVMLRACPRGARSRAIGFTLVELAVAIAVLGVLVSIAAPSFRSAVLNARRTAAVNELVATLNLARTMAISQRRPVTVCATSAPTAASPTCSATAVTWETGWVAFSDPDANGVLDASDASSASTDANGDGVVDQKDLVIRRHEALPSTLTVHSEAALGPRITFNSLGGTSNTGSFAVCDSRGWTTDARVITANSGGRVLVFDKTAPQVTISSCL